MFGSCLRNARDGGVGGEIEGVGLEVGWLGEFLERRGGACEASGVAGLGGELGKEGAVAVRGLLSGRAFLDRRALVRPRLAVVSSRLSEAWNTSLPALHLP